ncbi:MAG TPA: glycosyltransferase family 2 protein [Candidatus Paceibacterota bacterium]|nr:glycosyltransferase family 2 protein [Candidatus Paceibacterota bacterium]
MSLYRFFELIPGTLAWATLVAIVVLSRYYPTYAAIFIILFDIYWLLKTLYFSFHLRATFNTMKQYMKIDWFSRLRETNFKNAPAWDSIYHLVIFPMYKEPYSVVRESFESLAKANYPSSKFIVALGVEEKGGEADQEVSRKIREEFESKFFKFIVTTHPAGIPGELPGKGSNETWSGREAKSLIDELRIPYENILVSVFDVDTQISPEYFGRLTYAFLEEPQRQLTSYQPIPFFTNNVFEAPALARVIAFSCTFWQMVNQSRPERLTTFSSHSMPFKALVEIGFWDVSHVSEDSMIFWQCYLYYNGNWKAVPLFYPVSMDANVAPSFWQTMINLYKQQRRWAWGSENISYMLYGFVKNKLIPFKKKAYWSFHTIESFHSWATNAVIIFALGWLPLWLGGEIFRTTTLSYNLPQITKTLMTLASVGIASSAVLSILLLPPKPEWFRKIHYFLFIIQWLLMPATLIIFGALPAVEAQTRLLLGGKFRLGFWVTPKLRLNKS